MQLRYAGPQDVPALRALAALALPDFTHLQGEDWSHRFGAGVPWSGSFMLVALDEQAEPVGFVWADAALLHDRGLAEPWWCHNAVAVSPDHRGHGLGARLVEAVLHRAAQAGVTSVYGLCPPDRASWYAGLGFAVGSANAVLVASPLTVYGHYQEVELVPEAGDLYFLRDISPEPREPVRLQLE